MIQTNCSHEVNCSAIFGWKLRCLGHVEVSKHVSLGCLRGAQWVVVGSKALTRGEMGAGDKAQWHVAGGGGVRK